MAKDVRVQDIDLVLCKRAVYNLGRFAEQANKIDMALINDQMDEVRKAISYIRNKKRQMKRRKKPVKKKAPEKQESLYKHYGSGNRGYAFGGPVI